MLLPDYLVRLLEKLQAHHPSHIVGGYLRDRYLQLEPQDVDIATECDIPLLKRLFPSLNWTEKGFDFGVSRMVLNGVNIEFSSYPTGTLYSEHLKRDFTFNSMTHDGAKLNDHHGARKSLDLGVIIPLEDPNIHFISHPQAYLRAFRFVALHGFTCSQELTNYLTHNPHHLEESSENRRQQEGYKILQAPYLLTFIEFLHQTEHIKGEYKSPKEPLPYILDNLPVRLAYVATLIGEEKVRTVLSLFSLDGQLWDKTERILGFARTDNIPIPKKLFHTILIFKRYQYKNNPEKLKEFLLKQQNNPPTK